MTIGIIGCGDFGSLLASILKKYGKIYVFHYRNDEQIIKKARIIGVELSSLENVASCDIVIISTPISKTETIIKSISKLVMPNAIIMDVSSVKVYPCRWLKKYLPKNVNIIGTHPMFGPVSANFNLKKQTWKLKNHQIVLCPIRISKNKLSKLKEIFKDLELKIIETTEHEHDKQNAVTLGLVHFLGRSLWQTGIREQEMHTPSFTELLKIYNHTTKDSWRLFYDMNNYNPYAKKIRQKFISSCLEIDNLISKNDNITNIDSLRK
ncbi:prephenate dehydrogenase [Patescibacteria group bacterium]|nr:prephenate dehydrogenase [Patescibacteria group bacterium]